MLNGQKKGEGIWLYLGHLANRGLFDTPLMFVALFVLITIALGLYGAVSAVEALLLRWKRVA